MKKLFIPVIFATAVLFTSCDNSVNSEADKINDSISKRNTEIATVDNAAQSFTEKAAMGGMMEVEAGKIAVEKATDADVKAFGQRMIDDHSKINQELEGIALAKDMILPTMLSDSQQKELEDLLKTGKDFDKNYVSMMVNDHIADIKEFQEAADNLSNPELKNFATNTLPTLNKHLTAIQEIQNKLK